MKSFISNAVAAARAADAAARPASAPPKSTRPRASYPKRGFASMDPAKRSRIARLGGLAVSQDREHMAAIGSLGGIATYAPTRDFPKTARAGSRKGGAR